MAFCKDIDNLLCEHVFKLKMLIKLNINAKRKNRFASCAYTHTINAYSHFSGTEVIIWQ